MNNKIAAVFRRWTLPSLWVYLTLLFIWVGFYYLSGDHFGVIGLLNAIAIYLFIPLPLVIIGAVVMKRRELWIGAGVAIMIFVFLWGNAFLPKGQIDLAGRETLTVMTYNVLGMQIESAPLINIIRNEDPDVVLLQEINSWHAVAIEYELKDIYPYQIFAPQDGVEGIGTISKYPIRLTGEQLSLDWIGVPQLMELDWGQKKIGVVNFHMWATGLAAPKYLDANFRHREAQGEVLERFAANYKGPLIVGGDANTSPLNDTYYIMTRSLIDSWKTAGFGLGHTFPGSDVPGSSRPKIGPLLAPKWMSRIDYVFTSNDWRAIDAHLAPFDGVSDHRGVVVELVLASD